MSDTSKHLHAFIEPSNDNDKYLQGYLNPAKDERLIPCAEGSIDTKSLYKIRDTKVIETNRLQEQAEVFSGNLGEEWFCWPSA